MVKAKKTFKLSTKKLIFMIVPLLIVCLAIIGIKVFGAKGSDWQLQVSDDSKDCYSSILNIYPNKDYVVLSATNSKVIAKGKSNYPKSIDYLENEIKNYTADKETFMDYKIKTNKGVETYIDQYNSPELEAFIDTIKVENLFWCE